MKVTKSQLAARMGKSERTIIRYLEANKLEGVTQLPDGYLELSKETLASLTKQEEGPDVYGLLMMLRQRQERVETAIVEMQSRLRAFSELLEMVANTCGSTEELVTRLLAMAEMQRIEGINRMTGYEVKSAPVAQQAPVTMDSLGLVSWRYFAQQHGIPDSTVGDAIKRGRLPVVRGEWHIGSAIFKEALDSSGRAAFYDIWHNHPRFKICEQCPHTTAGE